MKKLHEFAGLGEGLKNRSVELYVYDGNSFDDCKEAVVLTGQGIDNTLAGISVIPKNLMSDPTPIRVLINYRSGLEKDKIANNILPHELQHVTGKIAEAFEIDSHSEIMALISGAIHEEFLGKLWEYLNSEEAK